MVYFSLSHRAHYDENPITQLTIRFTQACVSLSIIDKRRYPQYWRPWPLKFSRALGKQTIYHHKKEDDGANSGNDTYCHNAAAYAASIVPVDALMIDVSEVVDRGRRNRGHHHSCGGAGSSGGGAW